jgi:subtilase family serine protease
VPAVRRRLLITLTPLAAALAILPAPVARGAATTAASAATTSTSQVPVCKKPPSGRVRCFAIRVDRYSSGRIQHASTPIGYGPSDLHSAYALPAAPAGSGETVAIVDAYDDPRAEADLATYRSTFGLPACTSRSGCFRKVDQTGGHSYPLADPGWAQEISLDLDMVSAVCPACHILLVEATSASQANLGVAVDTAVALGADAVSNSYGGPDASDNSYGRYYHHSGVAITASTGDNGYGVSYPASSKWVTAVGGTSLHRSTSARRGWSEGVWSGSGSGCSTLNHASWQPTTTTSCGGRAVADIAAVANPATGVAVYDSYVFDSTIGWLTFGGTSAASPIVAAAFALAGNTDQVQDGSWVWMHHTGGVNDITYGSTGTCSTSRWCTAHYGWDGPTGWGTPKGVSAL